MSKYVKGLIIQDIASRLTGVQDALLCNVIGLDSEKTTGLRKELRQKGIRLFVVKNALARRATEGTKLAKAFDDSEGSLAVVWGCEDFVSLCKEMVELVKNPAYEKMKALGGVMDGDRLTQEKIEQVSKWPNRTQQLSILLGQILAPGSQLLSQLTSPGGLLASQISQIAEGKAGKDAGTKADASADAEGAVAAS
jgi:large subunit ribosomal protein L10